MNRERITLGGYEMWLDRKRCILFDKEQSKFGTIFDVMGTYPNIAIRSISLTKDEEKELKNYLLKN